MKKVIALGLSAAAFAAILAGCGDPQTNPSDHGSGMQTAAKSTMVFADTQGPSSMDPADQWSSWYTSRYGIVETLFQLDQNLQPQPCLAQTLEAVDNTTWKITLRDDVTFQNGKKLTAQSVKESWERTMGINARFQELLYLDSMQADGQVLTVKTSKPVPSFQSSLCEPLTGVIDVASGTDHAEKPIGTGPYQVRSYEPKKQCVVERYDGYWGGTPALESATFRIVADASALAMAQQAGESNVSLTIPSTSLSLFENDANFVVDGAVGSRGQIVYMNFQNEFLQDVHVRKAISMAIDKENYAGILNHGASVAANGLFPDSFAFGGQDLKGYEYDLDAAKTLLQQAGYTDTNGDGILEKDGKKLTLRLSTYTTKPELPTFSDAMASDLKKIGIELDQQTGAYDALIEQQKNGDFDLMLISMTMCPTSDPQYFADLALKTGGSANYGKYSNADVDALIGQLDQEFDAAKRNELSRQIQQKVLDDAGFVVIGHSKFTNVLNAKVKDCPTNPSEYYLLNAKTSMGQ